MNASFQPCKNEMYLDAQIGCPEPPPMSVLLTRLQGLVRADARSESQIADELGLSPRRFNHYVQGNRALPTKYVSDVCRVLGTHPNYLYGWSNEKRPINLDVGNSSAAVEEQLRILQRILSNCRGG